MKKLLAFFILLYVLGSVQAQVVPDANGVVHVTATGSGNGTTWGTPADLSDALRAAKTDLTILEVWIKGGTYKPKYDTSGVVPAAGTAQRKKTLYVRSNLKVYGSLTGTETVISNNGNYGIASTDTTYFDGYDGTYYSYNVVYMKNADVATLLNAVVVKNGNTLAANKGGGLLNDGSSGGNSVVSVNNCIFRDNKSTALGGGVCNWGNGGYAKITFTNCSFVNNQASALGVDAGAVANYGNNSGKAYAVFTNCTFVGNTAMGKGGAIENNGYTNGIGDAQFNNCIFKYNQSTNNLGGVLFNNGQSGNANTTFRNCVFYANRGNLGANLAQSDCSGGGTATLSIVNCSYYERAGASGVEIIQHLNGGGGGTVTSNIYNSILWKGIGYAYSAASTFTKSNTTTPPFTSIYNVSNTIIQGITPSGTTYNFYPKFMDTANADLRLQMCSPAMEVGDNSLYSGNLSSDLDLGGGPRLVNSNIDLGAYEAPYQFPLIIREPVNAETCLHTDTSFSVAAMGDSLLYQWQVKTTSSGTFTNVVGATHDTLSIASADTSMNGWQYRLIIKNCMGADTSITVMLTVKTGPIFVLPSSKAVCAGDTLYLKVVSLAGSGVSYNWSGPNGFTSNTRDTFITPVNSTHAGLYVLTSSNGICSLSDTMTVRVDTALVLSVSATNPLCTGKTLYLDINDVMTGNTYAWTGPAGFTSALKNPSVTLVSSANSGTYTVKITGSNSCKNVFSRSVTVVPPLPLRTVQKY